MNFSTGIGMRFGTNAYGTVLSISSGGYLQLNAPPGGTGIAFNLGNSVTTDVILFDGAANMMCSLGSGGTMYARNGYTVGLSATSFIDANRNISANSISLAGQSSVRAYHNTTQSIGGSWTQLLFNTVASPGYDNKSEWNTTTSRFTAAAAGTYLVSVTCLLSTYNANNRVVMEVQKGGVAYQRLFDLSSSGTWLQADGFCTVQITNPSTEYLTFHLIALSGTVGTNGGSYGNAVTIHRIM